jgi:hypothetical protein
MVFAGSPQHSIFVQNFELVEGQKRMGELPAKNGRYVQFQKSNTYDQLLPKKYSSVQRAAAGKASA